MSLFFQGDDHILFLYLKYTCDYFHVKDVLSSIQIFDSPFIANGFICTYFYHSRILLSLYRKQELKVIKYNIIIKLLSFIFMNTSIHTLFCKGFHICFFILLSFGGNNHAGKYSTSFSAGQT
jgi:hypothetical protein